MHRTRLATGAFLGLLAIDCPGSAGAASPLLDEVVRGNRATLDSIHTFSCRITLTYAAAGAAPTGKPVEGEYWRSGSTVRMRCANFVGRQLVDVIAKDSSEWGLSSGATERHGWVSPDHGRLPGCDAWALGLVTNALVAPGTQGLQRLPLDELLQRGQKVGQTSRRHDGGRDSIVVELMSTGDGRRELWFDPKFNYLSWKMVSLQFLKPGKRDERRVEWTVTRFTEAAPALYFPAQVEMSSSLNGNVTNTESVAFSDIRINEPLPPDVFHFRFPEGTKVSDRVSGKSYVTGADGNPAGPLQDMPAVVAPPVPPPPGHVTRSEPTPWSSWILPCSVGILGGAAGLWVRGRWLSARASRPG
jgi:hypothetical protein